MSNVTPFPYAGAIDADGHILEPPDLWEKYIDPKYRDRTICLRTNRDGLEVLELAGGPAKYIRPGQLAQFGAMGKGEEVLEPHPDRTYVNQAPFGAMDAKERLARMDQEGLDKAIIYPSLGLLWEAEDIEDLELEAAYARAYNRWVEEFCAGSGGRLIPIAHISMGDPYEAARELERAVKHGAKGAFFVPFTPTNKSHGHPDYDPFWAKVQELDVPVGIHPSGEPPAKRVHQRFREMQKWAIWHYNVHGAQGPLQAFTALFQYGLFERFPKVKVVVLESGAGWAGYLLNRMDAVYDSPLGRSVPLKEKPSFYFYRQCWISGDPDEKAFANVVEFVGPDKFFWASDFPHFDHTGDYMEELRELVEPLSATTRQKVVGENVKQVYGL
ncbi:MAG TPA: amidohydrolase family protein [Candidatus Binatia bacterium]|jgi:predicted TIM-barrel fold metal-dependent hydrolase|nr:amidohydrolase family protein [Candidatus Binatia bacterium]